MQPNLEEQINCEIERAWHDAAPRIYLSLLKSVEQSIRHNPEYAMRRDLDAIVARSLEQLLAPHWLDLVAECRPRFEDEYRTIAAERPANGRCDRQMNFTPRLAVASPR
jgi:hypothetical protein